MDDTTQKIFIGLFSAVAGFMLPYAAKMRETSKKANRIKSALLAEFRFAKKEMDSKLDWLGRDVTKHINHVEERKIVDYEGKKLYLGEKEHFELKCKYWDENYSEIVEILSETEFILYAGIHRKILEFSDKFAQMKLAFDNNYGDSKEMAKACYDDLIDIRSKLKMI